MVTVLPRGKMAMGSTTCKDAGFVGGLDRHPYRRQSCGRCKPLLGPVWGCIDGKRVCGWHTGHHHSSMALPTSQDRSRLPCPPGSTGDRDSSEAFLGHVVTKTCGPGVIFQQISGTKPLPICDSSCRRRHSAGTALKDGPHRSPRAKLLCPVKGILGKYHT